LKVLGISGSPHRDGNTAYATRFALGKLEELGVATRYASLAQLRVEPCLGCWHCAKERRCVKDDDMGGLRESLLWCDGLILGSPVYMGMVSGQMKAFMDRCAVFRPSYDLAPELSGKAGCGIACGNFRNGGQETTLQNIHTFLLQQNMRAISDGPGFSHAGGTIVGDARDDALGLRTIENLARNLAAALGLAGATTGPSGTSGRFPAFPS
jgi:multimeric flavodoxin WrbA